MGDYSLYALPHGTAKVTLSHHDPDTRHILNARKTERDNEWCRRQVGDMTYLRSLMILGYSDNDARTELNLLKLLKR